jgi:hypothetical protein
MRDIEIGRARPWQADSDRFRKLNLKAAVKRFAQLQLLRGIDRVATF